MMKTFQFTLVLKNVAEDTPDIEDKLYEANCSDALVNFRSGAVYLDFDREASSLDEAVISAINDVRSASSNGEIAVASVAPENLVTESEIAKRLKKKRQTVSLWIKGTRRKLFPSPVMRLSDKSPLWKWSEVTQWLFDNHVINDYQLVKEALFLTDINAALEECDKETRESRYDLLRRIGVDETRHHHN